MTRIEEKVGSEFVLSRLLEARELTFDAIHKISEQLTIGILETEAKELAHEILNKMGAQKHWHKINIRFGENTTKSFRELSKPQTRLEENDIAYIDIGPVWDGYEGDLGTSIVFGKNPRLEKLAADSKKIFDLAAKKWKEERLSGEVLFNYCQQLATNEGWSMMGRHMSGHRLSDFPHAAHFRGPLSDIHFSLSPNAWVLEICLIDHQTNRGSFYEDLLI